MTLARGSWSSKRGEGHGITFLRTNASYAGAACLIWPYSRDTSGYAICALDGKTYKASIMICTRTLGPRPSPKHNAAFSCGGGHLGCVHPQHVTWKTHKETMMLAAARGRLGKKQGAPFSKLTEVDVAQMKTLRGSASYSQIGGLFGVKHKQVGRIFREEHWIGGKRGIPGGARGRRSMIAKRPRLVMLPQPALSYPYIVAPRDEHADVLFVNSIVPYGLPGREDVCQAILIALVVERRITRDALTSGGWRAFKRDFFRENFEGGGFGVDPIDLHAFHLAAEALQT